MGLTRDRRRLAGLGLLAIGLTLVCLSASASLGLLTERASSATSLPPSARSSETMDGTFAEVTVDALGHSLPLAVGVPGLPVPQHVIGSDQHVDTAALPLPVKLGIDVSKPGGAGATSGPGSTASIESLDQRAITPLAAGAAIGAVAFASAGLIAYFFTSIKTWAARALFLPAVGLYARVTRAEVFDNAVRELIFGAIRARPGISASDLAKLANVSWGTTTYHLEVLEQNRMVSSLRKGRHRRYFENGADLATSKDVVALLQNPVTASIAQQICNVPGATQKDLARATGMTPQALHWHIVRLCGAGIVRKERAGRFVKHYGVSPS